MTVTEPPDGLYIRWQSRVRRAHETSDPPGTVLVNLEPGEQVPATYERDEGTEDWIYIPERELEEMFHLRTFALWQGIRCRVTRRLGQDRLLLTTPLTGEDKAAELGLTPTLERGIYATEVSLTEVTHLIQERTDLALD